MKKIFVLVMFAILSISNIGYAKKSNPTIKESYN